jgi:hypothetical protein
MVRSGGKDLVKVIEEINKLVGAAEAFVWLIVIAFPYWKVRAWANKGRKIIAPKSGQKEQVSIWI